MALRAQGVTAALFAVLVASGAAQAQVLVDRPAGGPAGFVPGEVIVRYRPFVTNQSAQASVLAASVPGAAVKDHLLLPNTEVVSVPVGQEAAAAAALASNPDVDFAEPNYYLHADAVPNDTSFDKLWGLNNHGQTISGVAGKADADIDAVEAWNLTKGIGTQVLVAVIDTGIAMNHPDLAGHIYINPGEYGGGKETNGIDDDGNGFVDDWRGWDFVNNDNNPTDDNEHGTHVSGTIGGISNNSTGVAGVAGMPTASGVGVWGGPKLMGVKVLDSTGSGTLSQVVNGMTYAGMMHAKVANMSLGGTGTSSSEDNVIKAYPNTLYVVAAGNDGVDVGTSPHNPCVPASLPDAANKLCIAATDNNDGLASFSNYSSTHVDLGAPGVQVLSTVPKRNVYFSDNFETDIAGRWTTADAGQTGVNRWARSSLYHTSGTMSLDDSPAGGYANGLNTWIRIVNPVNLTGGTDCSLQYNAKFSFASGDGYIISVSFNGSTWYSTSLITGSWNGARSVNLSGSFSNVPALYFRFNIQTNSSGGADGIHIDDVKLDCTTTGTPDVASYDFFDGTSMATPHVSGAAAFLFAKFPTATVAVIKDKILRSVDKIASLTGKTVTGGRLNLYKAGAESSLYKSGNSLYFIAGAGETNNLTITRVQAGGVWYYVFTDPYSTAVNTPQSGSRIVPGAGCARGNDTAAKCAAASITSIIVDTNDLNDVIDARTIPIPLTINSGAGNDFIYGGTAGDRLIGGPDADRFYSGAGNDTIIANDGVADLGFNCGENAGDTDVVYADPGDPIAAAANNCEVVHK